MKKLSSQGQIHPIFSLLLLGVLSVPMGFYGMYLYIAPSLPEMSSLQKAPLEKPLQIYTKDQVLIAEFGDRLSLPVSYPEIPEQMIHAFLAAEDSSFFEHSGVSFKALGRALSETVSGGAQTGGSTITMQVAKNYYLTPERTLRRKLTEVFLARKIEQNLNKEDILTLYVNKIFLGKNAYGVQAAAKIYYNKTLDQLTLAERAMIAGLPKAPSKYNPIANPERALERRNWIIGRMLQLGYINQTQYEQAITEPVQLKTTERRIEEKFPYLAEMTRKELVDRYGAQVVNSGFKVYTTVTSERQEMAEEAVRKGLEAYDIRHGWRGAEANDKPLSEFIPFADMWPAKVTKVNQSSFVAEFKDGTSVTVPWSGMNWVRLYRNANNPGPGASRASQIVKLNDIVRLRPNEDKTAWRLVQVPKVQGQLIAINPNSGALEAVVGGYDFYHSKFNRATQGWRQPGSTIKPFVYGLALERGMTPHTLISDAPIRIGKWSPKNSDGRYLGLMPLRRALYLSRNTVSVRILQSVGVENARQFFMDIGLHDNHIPRNYTIALGTPQVLPIQMAVGYAAFANGGYRVQPYFIERIDTTFDKTIFKANPAYACISCAIDQREEDLKALKKAQNQLIDIQATENLDDTETNKKDSAETEAKDEKPVSKPLNDKPLISGDYRQAHRILKSRSAYDMANILRDVIQHGTGRAALKLGRADLGGKTGTTNDAKDAWFAGFNGNLVTITWVGFDTPSTLGRREYGGIAALPIWTDFMGAALQDKPYAWVHLDTKAKDPIKRTIEEDGDDDTEDMKRQQRDTPPVARPLYRPTTPAPTAPVTKRREDDFADLPGEEITLPEEPRSPKSSNTVTRPNNSTQKNENNPSQESPLILSDPNNIF